MGPDAGSVPPLRVLAVIDGLHLAGAQKLLLGLAREGVSTGIELDVVSLEAPGATATVIPELHAAGVRIWSLDAERLLDLRAFVRLVRLIRGSDHDLVHAHLRYAITMAPLAARLGRIPSVCSFHHVPTVMTPRGRLKEWLAVRAATFSDVVLTVSWAQRRGFEQRYRLGRSARWQVLPNGIDLNPFLAAHGSSLPKDLRALTGPGPVVVMVARLLEGKGHEVAVEAWPQVLARVSGACLLLVGDGPLERRIVALAEHLGIADRVVLAGARRDVPAIVAGADLVVLPSESEALPTVLIEAAAAGRAVVATRVGGIPEIVDHARTGLLVPPRDPQAFAGSVVELLEDREERERMGRAARILAEERFAVARWAARMADLYRTVVMQYRASPRWASIRRRTRPQTSPRRVRR